MQTRVNGMRAYWVTFFSPTDANPEPFPQEVISRWTRFISETATLADAEKDARAAMLVEYPDGQGGCRVKLIDCGWVDSTDMQAPFHPTGEVMVIDDFDMSAGGLMPPWVN
jgi:hypothetical protein